MARAIVIIWTALIGIAFLYGLGSALEVAEATARKYGYGPEFVNLTFGFAMAFSAVVHFVIWCIVAIPTFVISVLFYLARRREQPELLLENRVSPTFRPVT